jgi:glutamate-ammonia-ligase adenylyltransferase
VTAAVPLAARLRPCGPVIDKAAAVRVRERLGESQGPDEIIAAAWPALAPVFAASPYLSQLAVRAPERLARILQSDPAARLAALLRAAKAAGAKPDVEAVGLELRRLKGELHLLTALADLGGVWDLTDVTLGLSRFADQAVQSALLAAAREAKATGWITEVGEDERGPVPGFFVIALGKLGAFELNYSSDIDVAIFYEPDALPLTGAAEATRLAARLVERLSECLQARTPEGYVFRVDLRLRPDPLSTPVAGPVAAALHYYQTVGQNWERAAMIKARPLAGDLIGAQAFLAELSPFIWRRNLDFAAIADIHAIKRQIHVFKVDDRLTAKGSNLKLGHGGIREVEFYVQTQQLIHGGRDPALRAPGTLAALEALRAAGRVSDAAAQDMAGGYVTLRGLEHRIQMIADEQTHVLPEDDDARRAVSALAGFRTLRAFDASVGQLLTRVNQRYGELFGQEEPLSASVGSLVFTGVEDDAETLATLTRLGFAQPDSVTRTIRGWHHGHIRGMRNARERELFTRLAPRLLEAAASTGAPDIAFARFADFFEVLASSIQVQSLFLAHPELLDLVVQVMAFAPRFARTLARRPAVLDALLDPSFFGDIGAGTEIGPALARETDFEAVMDLARRLYAESAFRIGAQVLSRRASAQAAGRAFADLADDLVAGLAQAALKEVIRAAGPLEGDAAVIALGSCGSREMTATSDLDLMTLYACPPGAVSAGSGLSAATFQARFTQRLIAALSALTAAGGLYKVDLQLRPSGAAGPVAVSLAAFQSYYAGEAETWELMALCRARVVWATSPAFADEAATAIETALRQPRDPLARARDVREMRALLDRERPPWGDWDLKLRAGGLLDLDFIAQYLQLAGAATGGPLRSNTGEALAALTEAWPALAGALRDLHGAWTLEADLLQVLKIALDDGQDPAGEPKGLQALLARAGGASGFGDLQKRLAARAKQVRLATTRLITPDPQAGPGDGPSRPRR